MAGEYRGAYSCGVSDFEAEGGGLSALGFFLAPVTQGFRPGLVWDAPLALFCMGIGLRAASGRVSGET